MVPPARLDPAGNSHPCSTSPANDNPSADVFILRRNIEQPVEGVGEGKEGSAVALRGFGSQERPLNFTQSTIWRYYTF